jgi:hypothetical protein
MPITLRAEDTKQEIETRLVGLITTHWHPGGSSATAASDISTVTTNFNKNLSIADTTVQKALDTLDNLTITGEDSASAISTYTLNFNNNLSSADNKIWWYLGRDNLS